MIKTLLAQLKEYKPAAIKTPVFVAFEVIFDVLIPYFMSLLVNDGITARNMNNVWLYGGLMLLCAFLALWAGAQSGKYAAVASAGFAKNLRDAEFKNIQNFAFSNIDEYSTGGLITRMMTDVTNVQNSFQMIIRMCVRSPLMFIFSLGMVFYLSPRIGLIFLIVVIFLAIALFGIIFLVRPIFEVMFKKYDKLNENIQENIAGIRAVKSFVREDYEIDRFDRSSEDIYKINKKAEKILVFNSPIMQLSMYALMIGISWVGAKQVVAGNMEVGTLMSLFTYTGSILMSLMMLSMVFVMVSMSIASAKRITEVITQVSYLESPKNGITEIKDGNVEFDHVYFNYKENDSHEYVLDDINFTIPSGTTFGVLGATGSAKSSLVQLIPRLYDVTKGSVKVAGIDVRDYDLKDLRDKVGVVLQKNVLFSGTILENMRWGDPDATEAEIMEACRLAQADEFIQRMPDQYNTYINQGGTNVSGGQRQRLCIARALLKKPKILILDDSTSAVDTKTDSLIRQAFLEKIPDTTRIIISQRISSIQDADNILVLDNGKISAIGTHEELLKTNAIYRQTFEAQQKGDDQE